MATKKAFTDALTTRLRSNFTGAQIGEWADMVAHFHGQGLHIDDVFPQGMPTPDILVMKAVVPLDGLNDAIAKIGARQHIRRIEIFPLGLPAQNAWRVRVGMGLK